MDVSALRLCHNSISVLYQRCIAVYALSKNVPSNVRQCAEHRWNRFWHNRMHCDVTEVDAFGFLPPLNGRHCSSTPGLRTHASLTGVLRKSWETGTHSTQCLFWHFIMTYLCHYIYICRHNCSFFPTFPTTAVLSLVVFCQQLGRNNWARSLVVNEHAQTASRS